MNNIEFYRYPIVFGILDLGCDGKIEKGFLILVLFVGTAKCGNWSFRGYINFLKNIEEIKIPN